MNLGLDKIGGQDGDYFVNILLTLRNITLTIDIVNCQLSSRRWRGLRCGGRAGGWGLIVDHSQ